PGLSVRFTPWFRGSVWLHPNLPEGQVSLRSARFARVGDRRRAHEVRALRARLMTHLAASSSEREARARSALGACRRRELCSPSEARSSVRKIQVTSAGATTSP